MPTDQELVLRWKKQQIPTLSNGTKVLKVTNFIFDVFSGSEGWTDHSRIVFNSRNQTWYTVLGLSKNWASMFTFFKVKENG